MSKTIKVKTDYGGSKHITAGKVYDAEPLQTGNGNIYQITDDHGDRAYILLVECAHLHGHNWKVVE